MSGWLERMFYAPHPGPLLKGLSHALAPMGYFYGGVVRSRLSAQRTSQEMYRSNVPVLSVGNYVAGGGGKTPMVIWLAQYFKEKQLKPAVLIRGYASSGAPRCVQGTLSEVDRIAVGDEATLISETLGDVPVYVGPDRVAHAKLAEVKADVLILDDGLQHTALYRDWDVVCFKGRNPLGNGRCLPAGPLREPVPENQPPRSSWLHYVLDGDEIWSRADAALIMGLQKIQNKQDQVLEKDQPLHLLCGVARPSHVRDSLLDAGWQVSQMTALADHEPITENLLKGALSVAGQAGCQLVMTEKDGARLEKGVLERENIYLLKTALKWRNSQERKAFCDVLDQIVLSVDG